MKSLFSISLLTVLSACHPVLDTGEGVISGTGSVIKTILKFIVEKLITYIGVTHATEKYRSFRHG